MTFPVDPLDFIRPLTGVAESMRGNSKTICFGEAMPLVRASRHACQIGEVTGITLDIEPVHPFEDDDALESTAPLVRALIEWGIGGVVFKQAIVDFVNGTHIAVGAESICTVTARYDAAPLGPNGCDPCCLPPMTVRAGLFYGCVSRGGTLTEVANVDESDGRCRIPIPPFAVSFTVLPVDGASVAVDLGFCGPARVRTLIVTPLSNENQHNALDQIPIPNGARFVEVVNLGPGRATAIVMFRIAI